MRPAQGEDLFAALDHVVAINSGQPLPPIATTPVIGQVGGVPPAGGDLHQPAAYEQILRQESAASVASVASPLTYVTVDIGKEANDPYETAPIGRANSKDSALVEGRGGKREGGESSFN